MPLRISSESTPPDGWPIIPPSSPVFSKAPGRFYDFCKIVWLGVFGMTMRIKVAGMENVIHSGGLVIAVSHVGHLDPIVVSAIFGRRIAWISRAEGYKSWLMSKILHHGGAFLVDRTGPALPTMREGLRRLQRGQVVGIFPEGELMRGTNSVLRGAGMKQGVCFLANRSGRPILPVVVLGTDRLEKIGPWLPVKRGRLWILVGKPIHSNGLRSDRASRAAIASRLNSEYIRLYSEIREKFDLPESTAP